MTTDLTSRAELRYAGTLSGVIALRMLGLFMILPVFMVLARDIPGYSPQAAGLAVGIYGLTQAMLQQPFGWLSDRWGRRPVMLLGLSLFAVGGVIAALAETMNMIILGRALQGCGAIAGVAMAFAADLTRPERRPLVMALIGIGIGAAFLISMVLAVPLSTLLGLSGLFWLTAVLALLGMGLVMTVPVAARATFDPQESRPGTVPVLWMLSLSVFLLHFVMTLLFVALPPWLVGDLGFELHAHWKIYLPAMIVSVLAMLPLLKRAGRDSLEHRVLPVAFVGLAIALALLTAQSGLYLLTGFLALYFFSFNLLEASMPSLLSRMTGSRGRGRRMGLYSTFQFLGAFAGGVAGGALLGSLGARPALLLAGLVSLLWGGLLGVLSKRVFLTDKSA